MSNPVICVTSLSPVANLSEYLRAIARFPKLESQQERDLAQRLRRDNDPQAAWQLVTSHLRYVATIARGYLGYGIAYEDLITGDGCAQSRLIALIVARQAVC